MKLILIVALLVVGALIYVNIGPKPEASARGKHDTSRVVFSTRQDVQVVAEANPHVGRAIEEWESFVQMTLANRQAPGAAVAIVRDTSIIFLKGFGLREWGKPDSIDAHTVFRLGSVSKSVAATLAAVLVNEKVIHWDDPVIKYLPSFRLKTTKATQALTIRHILSHTEGLPYHAFTDLVDQNAPVDTLIRYLANLDLTSEPGQLYSYQNVGFSLIGKIAEAALHKPFEEVITQKLFAPLRMYDASASYEKMMAAKDVAKPHRQTFPMAISKTYYSVAPAGGINASASDMGRWLQALMRNPEVLPRERVDEMLTPQVRAVARNMNFWSWKPVRRSYYALGWRLVTFKDDTIAYHGGYVNHYRCEVAIDRKKKVGIVVLVNSPGMLADQAIPRFFKIYDHYYDSIRRWKPARSL